MALPTKPKSKRGALVPRAVFAVALAFGSVPSVAACHSEDSSPRRPSAQLRPSAPTSSPPPPSGDAPRPPPPPATLEPLDAGIDAGIDAGSDAGVDAGRHARRVRRIRPGVAMFPGVAVRPPPPYGVAMMTVAVRMPYGVAVE